MLSINTNLSSMIAQQSLTKSTNILNQAIERMTTGAKLNHASDNAANYSIATNMSTQLNSYEVAQDNVAMGLDLVTTASENLELINSKLTRLRDLQEQAMNGTYGEDSLKAINKECNALVDEVNRLYANCEYNGIDLMKGTLSTTEESKFIKEIDRRDTSEMTALSSIDPTQEITSGIYSISTAEELAQLATMTNNGLVGVGTEFVLANDIDLQSWCDAHASEGGWTPIGMQVDDSEGVRHKEFSFRGIFDGNGYVISNLTINRSGEKCQGLFGDSTLLNVVEIKNLGVENANVSGGNCSAVITGTSQAKIVNCYATGNVSANGVYAGGISGWYGSGTIDSCYSTASISNSADSAGGLVAAADPSAIIINSYATGNVTSTGNYVGGLAGYSRGTITNSYSTGNVTGKNYVGGFVGVMNNSSLIKDCYEAGNINVTGTTNCSGGFAGFLQSDATLENCHVYGNSSTIKGLISGAKSSGASLTLRNCSYNSAITCATQYVKGVNNSEFADCNITTNNGTPPTSSITNNAQINTYNRDVTLQVGINSDSSCQIGLKLGADIGGVDILRNIGRTSNSNYLTTIDNLLSKVSAKQVEFGAVQNRLESALEEIATHYDNLVSSRSTLRDADIAKESSEYIRGQILQQASATLLSTANQSPAIALTLLTGIR